MSEERWIEDVGPLVAAQIPRLNIGLDNAKKFIRELSQLTSWCIDERIPIDVESVLDPDSVNRYCNEALYGPPSSAATVRSDLRRLGRALTKHAPWEPPAPSYSRTKRPAPYSDFELAQISRDIQRQSTAMCSYSAGVMLDLGLGAGLDGKWNTKVRGSHVTPLGDAVQISVPPPMSRMVVVRAAFAERILGYAEVAGDGPLVARKVGHKNAPNFIAKSVVIDQGRLPFVPGRLRSNWVKAHLEAGTLLTVLMEAAGLKTLWQIRDVLPFVPPPDDAEARRQLRDA